MELICPACRKWAEIAEHEVFVGNRCRCNECWALLRVESARPLRIQVEPPADELAAQAGSRALQGGKEHG